MSSQEQNDKKGLIFVSSPGQSLSKDQQAFNRLVHQIEALNQSIEADKRKLDLLLSEFNKRIPNLTKQYGRSFLAIAQLLADAANLIKLGANQSKELEQAIIWLCDEAFVHTQPTDQEQAFYDAWALTSYKDKLTEQARRDKQRLADMIKVKLGLELDINEFEDSPEGYASLQQKVMDLIRNHNPENTAKHSNKTKSAKKIAKQAKLQAEQTANLKTIRSIYLSLAKLLHPDTEIDLAERAKKEEIMKKITVAYNDKDLNTLLKLEMEWITAAHTNLQYIVEDKLKSYISILEEQVNQLESKKTLLYQNPRYQDIAGLVHLNEKNALTKIKQTAKVLKDRIENNQALALSIKHNPTKKSIINFVSQVQDAIQAAEMNKFNNSQDGTGHY